jgi:hypothetical protein
MTFWEVLVKFIVICWCTRVTFGAVYGIHMFRKQGYSTSDWDLMDNFIAGPAFWIGWLAGTILRWLSKKIFKRFYK